jgi:hypothetical protein
MEHGLKHWITVALSGEFAAMIADCYPSPSRENGREPRPLLPENAELLKK